MPERQPCSRSSQGCKGAAVEGFQECLEHLSSENLDRVLDQFGEGGPLDARGTRINGALLQRILAAAPTANGRRQLHNICFNGARFIAEARFEDAQFGSVLFLRSQFERDARFQRARFDDDVRFTGARFAGQARFDDAAFMGDALFRSTRFAGDARFQRAHFRGDGYFDQAKAKGAVRLEDAVFLGKVWGAEGPFATALHVVEVPGVTRDGEGRSEVESGAPEPRPPAGPAHRWQPITERPHVVEAADGERDREGEPERAGSKPADLAGSTDAMRQSTRWIAGAFAGIGVVLVAGLQLGRLGQLKLGDWRLHVALLAMAVALACVGRVIWLGSKVLAAPYSHIEDLQGRQLSIDLILEVPAAARFRVDDLKTLLKHRDDDRRLLKAANLEDEQRLKIAHELEDLNQLADDALTIENFHRTSESYKQFQRGSRRLSVVIVAAIAVFAWVSTATIASHPTLVQIRLTAEGQSRKDDVLGLACVRQLIPAVVTSPGSLLDKLVGIVPAGSAGPEVLAVPPNCRGQPHRFKLTSALATMDAGPRRIAANALLKPRRDF